MSTQTDQTPAYVIGCLRDVTMGPAISAYLEGIDATLEPFGGRFVIHGGPPETLEGAWQDDLIVIAFPDLDHARDWYRSDAYQQILPLRTESSVGDVVLIEGVPAEHRATDILEPEPERGT